MAALLDQMSSPAPTGLTGQIQEIAQGDVRAHSHTAEVYKSKMPELVKGAGYAGPGGNAPLTDQTAIMAQAAQATLDLRAETMRGFASKQSVVKSLNPAFLNKYGALSTALSTPSMWEQLQQVVGMIPGGGDALKSFTAGNLGIGSTN